MVSKTNNTGRSTLKRRKTSKPHKGGAKTLKGKRTHIGGSTPDYNSISGLIAINKKIIVSIEKELNLKKTENNRTYLSPSSNNNEAVYTTRSNGNAYVEPIYSTISNVNVTEPVYNTPSSQKNIILYNTIEQTEKMKLSSLNKQELSELKFKYNTIQTMLNTLKDNQKTKKNNTIKSIPPLPEKEGDSISF